MKTFLPLALLFSFSAMASVPVEDMECFSDMSDGACEVKETETSFKAKCTIDVMITLKSGEKVAASYVGNSDVQKNKFAVFLNDQVKEKAINLAGGEMFQKIQPFFSMKSCN